MGIVLVEESCLRKRNTTLVNLFTLLYTPLSAPTNRTLSIFSSVLSEKLQNRKSTLQHQGKVDRIDQEANHLP